MINLRPILLGLLFLFIINMSYAQLMKAKDIYNRADSLRGKLTPLRTCYDVLYYHLDIKVDIDKKFISGNNKIKFKVVEPFKRLQVDLFDNLSVEKVEYNGKPLTFTREYNAVFVDFPTELEIGKIDSFKVYYSGNPIQATRAPWDGGFDWKKDSKGKPWVATACQGLGASVWWPNKDHQSDEPDSMMISVAVPNEVMNVSNGKLITIEKLEDGFTKYHWKVSNPINNYNVALNIGDYAHFKETFAGEDGPLSVDYYILKENKSKISYLKKNANETLTAFEHWFGPYPFYEDGYKLVETAHLGMEHQSAIAYGNKFKNGYLGSDGSQTGWGLKWDFIVVHESGHEWFGNNITAKDLGDMWIHESFTNYSEALFIDYYYGKEASQSYINGNRRGIKNDIPLQGPYHVNKEGSGDMYNKGGVFHNMLRTIIDDDERWKEILRGLNEEFHLKTVNYSDIVTYLNTKSGFDFTRTFEQYIRRTSIPTLEIIEDSPGEFMIRWVSEVKGFDMPVHLIDQYGNRILIRPNTEFKYMKFKGLTKETLKVDTFNYYIGVTIQ